MNSCLNKGRSRVLVSFSCYYFVLAELNVQPSFSFFQLLQRVHVFRRCFRFQVLVSFSCYIFGIRLDVRVQVLVSFSCYICQVLWANLTPFVLVSFSCYAEILSFSFAPERCFSFFQLLRDGVADMTLEVSYVLVSFSCYQIIFEVAVSQNQF